MAAEQQQPTQDGVKDYLQPYRARIFYHLSIAGGVLLLPLGLLNIYQYNFPAGICIFLILAIVSIDAWRMGKGKHPPIPPWTITLPLLIGISFGIERFGFIASLWIYPVMLLFFFILPRIPANCINLAMALTITALAWHNDLSFNILIRFLSSALLTIIFVNLILNVMDRLYEKLHTAALVDDLTGAYNRRHMHTSLLAAQALAKRYDSNASVLLLDVDHFKSVNDKFGHSTGDEVLRKMVGVLRRSLRTVDTIFRIGGEEFLILLPETGQEQAIQVAEKLRGIIAAKPLADDLTVTISIGVGEMLRDENIDALLNRCDIALYQAKNEGRNRVCLAA